METQAVCGIEDRGRKESPPSRRLAIVHVVSSFQTGGAEQVVVDLAASQRVAGHDVLAVAIAEDPDGPRAEQLRQRGVEVHLVPKCPGFDRTLTARLAALFATKRVMLVHSHNHLALIYAAPAGWLHRVPVIHTKHGVSQDMEGRRWLRSAASAFVDAHVAVSQPTAAVVLGRREVDPPKLHVVANGIDLSRFAPDPAARARVRAELAIPEDAWVVGSVGRLSPVKNHALLVRAAARSLPRSGRLLLVGDGPERGRLAALAAELGASDRVLFAGERHDVPALLAALDVFALPSLSEGLPLALLEAMATGLPAVATDVGGVATALVDGQTGFLVPSGEVAPLAARLSELQANPALAAQMGRSGRMIALRRYSATRMADRYMDLYALLLMRHPPRVAAAVRPSALLAWIWGANRKPREITAAPDRDDGRPRGDQPSPRPPAALPS
ncbi:glycosyltransferase [Sorangium sp. So ce1078]|uniref:glycosyltransferase n=1 Tax=Sorangium sp. So ce1078 TaxID=3133329 RepID=UPI003F5EA5C2